MSNNNPYWTNARVEKLKKYWTDGLSGGQIAARLGGGITRNAIIGKISRLRAEEGTGVKRKPVKKVLTPPPAKAERVVKIPVLKNVPMPPPPVDLPEPTPLNVTLFDLGNNDCRWPISGEKSSMLFCGHDVVEGSSYCLCHKNRSARPSARADRFINELMKRVA